MIKSTLSRSAITFLTRNLSMSPKIMTKKNTKVDIAQRIVWMDLEMTGLDIENDHIMEIACLVTDAQLNVVATGPDIVINLPEVTLNKMNNWCKVQHGETGLTEACLKSDTSLAEAERIILKFVSNHVPEKICPLAGNSIYMDRMFLIKYMPKLNDYLHYRCIDVSTVKELAKRWYPREYSLIPQKKFEHRALNDILESVQELKYYKENIFKTVL